MRMITTAICKGGAGKSTLTGLLAGAAVKDGLRVLVVDADPQANITYSLGADERKPGTFEVISGTRKASEVLQKSEQGMSVITGSLNLSMLKTSAGSATRLRDALRRVSSLFDLCIIDAQASIGEPQLNALMAARDALVIPVETDPVSMQGLYKTIDTITSMRKDDLPKIGVVINRLDRRAIINKHMLESFQDVCSKNNVEIFGEIRSASIIREAASVRENLFVYAPRTKAAGDAMAVYRSIMAAIGITPKG